MAASRLRPAQHIATELHAHAALVFPDASIRLKRRPFGNDIESLQQMEKTSVAGSWQPAVEEHRHRREDDTAIGIVLNLSGRHIADAYRTIAVIALRIFGDFLVHPIRRDDAVNRTKVLF
jgi:hypothetical protein